MQHSESVCMCAWEWVCECVCVRERVWACVCECSRWGRELGVRQYSSGSSMDSHVSDQWQWLSDHHYLRSVTPDWKMSSVITARNSWLQWPVCTRVPRNGASKSGILAAMCLILERLELDLEVDVYQAVKQIRINRPQFIENFVSCMDTSHCHLFL